MAVVKNEMIVAKWTWEYQIIPEIQSQIFITEIVYSDFVCKHYCENFKITNI